MNLVWNMMLMSASCSYLQKFTPLLMMTAHLRSINESQYFVMIVVLLQIMMLCVLTFCCTKDSSNIQTISGILSQLTDPRGEYLENYRSANGCQKFNASAKAVCFTQLSDALIIQVNIFKYSGVSVIRLFPTYVLMRKFHLEEIEWNYFLFFLFFLSGFSFMNVHDSQGSRGRRRVSI